MVIVGTRTVDIVSDSSLVDWVGAVSLCSVSEGMVESPLFWSGSDITNI